MEVKYVKILVKQVEYFICDSTGKQKQHMIEVNMQSKTIKMFMKNTRACIQSFSDRTSFGKVCSKTELTALM